MLHKKIAQKRLAMMVGSIIGGASIGLLITFAVFSTTQEIPDTDTGTIGYALSKIIAGNWQTGSGVQRSKQLGGVDGEKYLRLTGTGGCSNLNQALRSISPDGTSVQCETIVTTRDRPILATIRDLDSSCAGAVSITNTGTYIDGSGNPQAQRTPQTYTVSNSDPIDLYEDDKIETTDKCLLASLYMPDNSIIRLSANTTITLRYAGIPGGSGATSTDLDGGEMWARVLKPITDDSYFNVNTQEASVGVRGTSVWIKRDSGITTALPIDSGKLNPTDIANNSGAIVVYPKYGDLTALGTPVPLTHTITVNEDGASTLAPYRTSANELNFYSTSTTAQIYNDKPFVRMATLADIMDFKAFSGSNLGNLATIRTTRSKFTLHGGEHMKWKHASVTASDDQMQTNSTLTQEFSRTLPSDENEKSTLCLGGDSAGTSASSLKQWWDAVPLGRTNCIDIGTGFLADYSKNDTAMYWANGQYVLNNVGTPTSLNNGYDITQIGNYIQYNTGAIDKNGVRLNDFSALSGATITFNLKQPVGNIAGTPVRTKFYLADFGDEKWFVTINGTCAGSPSPTNLAGNYICHKIPSGGTQKIRNYLGEQTITNISISITPTQLIFGNTPAFVPAFQNPIGTTIQSISISPPIS